MTLRYAVMFTVLRPRVQLPSAAVTCAKQFSSTAALRNDGASNERLVLVSTVNNVTTMTMNNPKKLNGWTEAMMKRLQEAFAHCASDPSTRVAVLTGADPYYCAGVNLSSSIRPMHPRRLHAAILENNIKCFDTFISFPKPLLVAVNGPGIGACVTSATVSDYVLASERATFSTPFARLGIPPEGCSSVHFERIMGKKNAERMLGAEGWTPTAAEAVSAGLIQEVVPHEKLMSRAQEIAEEWVKSDKKRWLVEQGKVKEYQAVNVKESEELADAFLSPKFLEGQYNFLKSKGKTSPALAFWVVKTLRPIWSKML